MKFFSSLRKRSVSLKIKLSALLLVMVLVPLLLLVGLQAQSLNQIVKEEIEEQQLLLAKTSATAMDRLLQEKTESIQSLVQQYKTVLLGGDRERIVFLLKAMKAMNPDIASFYYSTASGKAFDQSNTLLDISGFPNFTRIREEKTLGISDLLKDAQSGSNVIIIDIPLLDDAGTFQGLI